MPGLKFEFKRKLVENSKENFKETDLLVTLAGLLIKFGRLFLDNTFK